MLSGHLQFLINFAFPAWKKDSPTEVACENRKYTSEFADRRRAPYGKIALRPAFPEIQKTRWDKIDADKEPDVYRPSGTTLLDTRIREK